MGLKDGHNVDVEKNEVYVNEAAIPIDSFTAGDSSYAKIQRFAGRFKIEQRGIERVPEDERTNSSLVKVGTMVCTQTTVHPSSRESDI